MGELSFVATGLIVFGIQTFLSSRKQVWFGAIIPALYLVGVVIFFSKTDTALFSTNVIPFTLFFTIMIGAWISGYESRKKREKKELDKMKSIDLK